MHDITLLLLFLDPG